MTPAFGDEKCLAVFRRRNPIGKTEALSETSASSGRQVKVPHRTAGIAFDQIALPGTRPVGCRAGAYIKPARGAESQGRRRDRSAGLDWTKAADCTAEPDFAAVETDGVTARAVGRERGNFAGEPGDLRRGFGGVHFQGVQGRTG